MSCKLTSITVPQLTALDSRCIKQIEVFVPVRFRLEFNFHTVCTFEMLYQFLDFRLDKSSKFDLALLENKNKTQVANSNNKDSF